LKRETNFFKKDFKFFAGHSLGEYTALTLANSITFNQGLSLLKNRAESMQSAVPLGVGGMLAVLGVETNEIIKIINDNSKNIKCFLANDNSKGQIILSGKNDELDKFSSILKENKIKNIKLPVSAPFHCSLMNKATEVMSKELLKIDFKESKNILISNVTAEEISNINDLKSLLISQIEKRVRWRESILYMINRGVNQFIEIGPGKVLSGLIKRINKDVKISSINNQSDIESLSI
jgi:[acyl-carrier-protein] S-malonyltransferase